MKLATPILLVLATTIVRKGDAVQKTGSLHSSLSGSNLLQGWSKLHEIDDAIGDQGSGSLFGEYVDIPLVRGDEGEVAAVVHARLAISNAEHQRGLMYLETLADDEGMFFVYQDAPKQRVLWMKNTYVPLEAVWFTQDSSVQEVQHLIPHDLTYRWSARHDISLGLEVRDGFFQKHGLPKDGLGIKLNGTVFELALKRRLAEVNGPAR